MCTIVAPLQRVDDNIELGSVVRCDRKMHHNLRCAADLGFLSDFDRLCHNRIVVSCHKNISLSS